jgi:hypothetical protein
MNISDATFQLDAQIEFLEDEVHLRRIDLNSVAEAEERWQKILKTVVARVLDRQAT